MTLLLTTSAEEHIINPLDWPRCAKCNMPVQKFSVFDSLNAGITLVAECHGEQQAVTVPDEVLTEMLGSHMSFGTAFTEET